MRFTCYKTVTSVIFDKIIENKEDIYEILSDLQKREIKCNVRLKSGVSHNIVRVLEINNDKVDLRIIRYSSSLQKTIQINEIESVQIESNDALSIYMKSDVSRGDILDI